MGVLYLREYTNIVDRTFLNTQASGLFSIQPANTQVDFTNVVIDRIFAVELARLLEFYDLHPINLGHPSDVYIFTAISLTREPTLNYDDFVQYLMQKFPPGQIAIKDTLFMSGNPDVGKHISLIAIEEYQPTAVRVRRYWSSVLNVESFHRNGGAHNPQHFTREHYTYNDLLARTPYFRYAITQQEEETIRSLFPSGSLAR